MDDRFLEAVEPLHVPVMGTESASPLLYWLVRMFRPQNVLEVGMGYSTVFIAKAMQDNTDDLLVSSSGPIRNPAYFRTATPGKLTCIDSMVDSDSSAVRVRGVLAELGLDKFVTTVERPLQGASDSIEFDSIDFAWIDTWDSLSFVSEYWDRISPAGGVLAIHYLLTYPEGRAVLEYLESLRGPEGGRLEVFNIVEPHKRFQNSLTLIRRVSQYEDSVDLRPQGNRDDQSSVIARMLRGGGAN